MNISVRMTIYIILVFVIHISVRISFNILLNFRHTHICTNDYICSFRFASCIFLYEWVSILFLVFVMRIFVRMTIHIIFIGFLHAHLFTNDYPYYFWMDYRHAHICTNAFPYFIYICLRHAYLLYERLSILL